MFLSNLIIISSYDSKHSSKPRVQKPSPSREHIARQHSAARNDADQSANCHSTQNDAALPQTFATTTAFEIQE